MNAAAHRELILRQPFEPLEVRLSSGEVHIIPHPEFAMVLRNTLFIGNPESDAVTWCSLLHIASVRRVPRTVPV